MGWIDIKGAEYGEKLYRLLWKFEGSDYALAYDEMFPEDIHADPDENPEGYKLLEGHFRIMKDKTNREIILQLYRGHNNGKTSLEDVANLVDLKLDEVKERIKFFEANGMKKVL